MTERKHIEDALRACAEAGVREIADPWPEIRTRLRAEKQVPTRERRFVPRTRLGWALVAVAVMLFGTGAYAGTGWVTELFDDTAPEIEEGGFGVPINQKKTVDGATITLDKAYADQGNLVVGYSVRGGMEPGGALKVTDGAGRTFEYVGGLGIVTDPSMTPRDEERFSDLAFFEPSRELPVTGSHRFRLDLGHASSQAGRGGGPRDGLTDEPLVFSFEVPVREMQTISVGQTVEANGFSVTLARVENSPARSQAFLCFDPPRDEEYTWVPVVERPNIAESDVFTNESSYMEKPEKTTGCVGYDLFRSLYGDPGTHSFTVLELQGRAGTKVTPDKTITGPWTFEFEVPER